MKERGSHIRHARDRLCQELEREPTLSELAEATGIAPEDIAAAETANAGISSLQMETGEEGLTLEQLLGTEGAEERILEQVSLRQAVESLSERERMVILLRYYRNFTQERASRVLGVSQVQVSRLERKALDHLRRYFAAML
jgi:RNA polymerase sporulation-specific sigma factor